MRVIFAFPVALDKINNDVIFCLLHTFMWPKNLQLRFLFHLQLANLEYPNVQQNNNSCYWTINTFGTSFCYLSCNEWTYFFIHFLLKCTLQLLMKHYLFFRVDSLTFSKFYSIRVVGLPLIRMSIPLDVNNSILIFLPSDSTRICYSWRTPHLTIPLHVPHMLAVLFQ